MLYTIYLAQQIIALIEFKTALFSRLGPQAPGDGVVRVPSASRSPPGALPSCGLALWAQRLSQTLGGGPGPPCAKGAEGLGFTLLSAVHGQLGDGRGCLRNGRERLLMAAQGPCGACLGWAGAGGGRRGESLS